MEKNLSENLNLLLKNVDMKLAYENHTHIANLIEAVEEFINDKSTEDQLFVINVLYFVAITEYKSIIKGWSIHPLTKWLINKESLIQLVVSNAKQKDYAAHKQQMLILHYTGLLDKIDELQLNQQNTAKLISYIVNRHEKNTKTYFADIGAPIEFEHKDYAKTPNNLAFVENIFRKLELEECLQKVQEDRRRINLD